LSTAPSIILGPEASKAQNTNAFGYTLSDNEEEKTDNKDEFKERVGDEDILSIIRGSFMALTRGIKPKRVKSKHS